MAEDEIVYMTPFAELFCKLVERFVLVPENILSLVPETVMLRPCVAQAEREPRMQGAEEPLERAAVEDAGEDAVAARNGSEAVAVAEAEDLAGNGRDIGLLKSLHAERLEVGVAPDIVVAAKKIDIYTPVNEVDDCSKNPSITSWDNIAVLIPEVPDVPEHVEAFRLRR